MCRAVEPIRHACPDRIQVDVGHGGEDRAVVAQGLAFVAAFPESSLAAVFAIRPSRDRFDQTAHEPGNAAQTLAQDADSVRVSEQALAFAFDRVVVILARWEQSNPARCDFLIVPCCRFVWVDAQYQMQMIAHDRVGVDGDSEAFGHEMDTGFDPRLSVFEGLPGVAVYTAEERSPNASLDAMVCAGCIGRCDVRARPGHDASVVGVGRARCR